MRLSGYLARELDHRLCLFGVLWERTDSAKRIQHQEGSDAPIRDRAGRILGQHIAKNLLARAEPERVQHGDAARQVRLYGGCTRIRKIYVADLAMPCLALVFIMAKRRDSRESATAIATLLKRTAPGVRQRAHLLKIKLARSPPGPKPKGK